MPSEVAFCRFWEIKTNLLEKRLIFFLLKIVIRYHYIIFTSKNTAWHLYSSPPKLIFSPYADYKDLLFTHLQCLIALKKIYICPFIFHPPFIFLGGIHPRGLNEAPIFFVCSFQLQRARPNPKVLGWRMRTAGRCGLRRPPPRSVPPTPRNLRLQNARGLKTAMKTSAKH